MDEDDDNSLIEENGDDSDYEMQDGNSIDGNVDETNEDNKEASHAASHIEEFLTVPRDNGTFSLALDDGSLHREDADEMVKSFCEIDETKGEYFILSTLDEVKKLIDDYSERTSSHFVVHKKTKHFGLPSSSVNISRHRIQWHDIRLLNHGQQTQESMIEFDGVPHISVGHYQLNCQFGGDSGATHKEKQRKMKEHGVSSRLSKTPTKKCGCPAKIIVKQIIRYPEFKVAKVAPRRKRARSAALKRSLKTNPAEVVSEVLYIGRLADANEHKFHDLIQGKAFTREVVHRDIILKIQEMYLQNTRVKEIMDTLKDFVVNEMFWKQALPDPCRRRYYPRRKDIANAINRIRNLSKFTIDEEQKIATLIEEVQLLRKHFNIAFHTFEETIAGETIAGENTNEAQKMDASDDDLETDPADKDNDKDKIVTKKEERKVQTFIFCYQTPIQRRLMRMYSNVAFLTELHYDVPLKSALTYKCYVILVQTSVDYQVVGFIAVSKQKKNGLTEGLKLFQYWNSFWNPKYLFIDCCDLVVDSVSAVFPDAGQLLNTHSCEDKWKEFLSTPSNDVREYSEEIMSYLQGMQYSLTAESLGQAARLFEESEVWQSNEKLRQWFQGNWLHLAKSWVFGYRPEDLIVMHHLNFTVSDCLLPYKDVFNRSILGDGLVELFTSIAGSISDKEYEKYKKRNNEHLAYYKRFEKKVGVIDGLQGVPISLLPYVYQMYCLQNGTDFIITEDQIGVFTVSYEIPDRLNDWGSDSNSSNNGDASVIENGVVVSKDSMNLNSNGCGDLNISSDKTKDAEEEYGMAIVLFETEFSSIRYLNMAEVGCFTVSFGDHSSYPFCTCSFWNTYKFPCTHMTAVFCKVPGWRYNTLSPLYRFNHVIDIDTSCITYSSASNSNDKQCQVSTHNLGTSVGTQYEFPTADMFESPDDIGVTDSMLQHIKEFQEHVYKSSIFFKDKMYQRRLLEGLQSFVRNAKTVLCTKTKTECKDMNVDETINYLMRTCGDTFIKNFKVASTVDEKVNKELCSTPVSRTNEKVNMFKNIKLGNTIKEKINEDQKVNIFKNIKLTSTINEKVNKELTSIPVSSTLNEKVNTFKNFKLASTINEKVKKELISSPVSSTINEKVNMFKLTGAINEKVNNNEKVNMFKNIKPASAINEKVNNDEKVVRNIKLASTINEKVNNNEKVNMSKNIKLSSTANEKGNKECTSTPVGSIINEKVNMSKNIKLANTINEKVNKELASTPVSSTINEKVNLFKNIKLTSPINEKVANTINEKVDKKHMYTPVSSTTNEEVNMFKNIKLATSGSGMVNIIVNVTKGDMKIDSSNVISNKQKHHSSSELSEGESFSNELQLKRRKLTNMLCEVNDKKVASSTLVNAQKRSEEVKRKERGSSNVLPPGTIITLAPLTGKHERRLLTDKKIPLVENCSDSKVRKENIVENQKDDSKTENRRQKTETASSIKLKPMKSINKNTRVQTQPAKNVHIPKYVSLYKLCKKPLAAQVCRIPQDEQDAGNEIVERGSDVKNKAT